MACFPHFGSSFRSFVPPTKPHPFPGFQKPNPIPIKNKTNLDEKELEEKDFEEEEHLKADSFKHRRHKKRQTKIEPTEPDQTATLSPIQISQIAANFELNFLIFLNIFEEKTFSNVRIDKNIIIKN